MWRDRKLCQSIFQGTEICSLSTEPFSWHCPELDCNLLHHSQRVYDYKKAYIENPGFRKTESLPLLNFISILWYVSMLVGMLCLSERRTMNSVSRVLWKYHFPVQSETRDACIEMPFLETLTRECQAVVLCSHPLSVGKDSRITKVGG